MATRPATDTTDPAQAAVQGHGWRPAAGEWVPKDGSGEPWPVWEVHMGNPRGHWKALFGPKWVVFYRLVKPGQMADVHSVRRADVPALHRAAVFEQAAR